MSLDRANRQHVCRRCNRGHRNWRRDAESLDAASVRPDRLRRACSDRGRLFCGLALGTYRRDPFPCWYLFDIRTVDSEREDNLVFCSPDRAGSAIHNQSLAEEPRCGAFKDPATGRLQRLGPLHLLRDRNDHAVSLEWCEVSVMPAFAKPMARSLRLGFCPERPCRRRLWSADGWLASRRLGEGWRRGRDSNPRYGYPYT